jgi:UDP-glucose 4-epimerase
MKLLVTGAAGFIGGRLAAHFQSAGARVFVDVSREDAGVTKRWPLTESGLLQAMGGEVPDAILHAAGSGTVAKVAAQPALELPANLGALLAVLQYACAHAPKARLVLLSSAALYGNAPPTPQREDEARAPVSLYGLAKAQAEQLAAYYAHHQGVQATAVRLFSVYGPGLRKQLLWDAMTKFVTGAATFFGTGQERRDWVHIDDVCRFMALLLAMPAQRAFDVYNCAGSPATTAEVLSALAAAAGVGAPRFSGQTRPGDPQCLVADCSKAERELGWQRGVPWNEGAVQYAQWFLNARRLAGAGGLSA